MQINPRTLRYILAVAEERSFSRAAEKLYISQPSLSQHIARAEKEYGVQFFNRDVIPLTLTYAGERVAAAAQNFFLLEAQLSREIEDIAQNRSGKLVIGASATRGAYLIPRLFSSFKKHYPKINLTLKEGPNDELLELVQKGTMDFAFVGYSNPDVEHICLLNDRLLLAVSAGHPICASYQHQSTINLNLFQDEPFILLRPGQGIRSVTDKIFADYNMRPIVAYETGSFGIAHRMVQENLGCTFVTNSVRNYSKEIILYDLDRGIYSYPLLLVHRKNMYLSYPMKHFIELARKIGEELQVMTVLDGLY